MAWKAYRACKFEPVRELRLELDDCTEGEAVIGQRRERSGEFMCLDIWFISLRTLWNLLGSEFCLHGK